MAWTVPEYSHEDVDAAGEVIALGPDGVSPEAYEHALIVSNNWRTSHNYPLNTFQVTLRSYARGVESSSLVAQRIKRSSSIVAKLRRFRNMRLSQMQDLGGCRAVVSTAARARSVAERYATSDLKHELVGLKDYIQGPAKSGYRGIHLVYRYFSDKQKTAYNGLRIEVQLRSRPQHAWATAVETVGTFVRHALKSSMGPDEWLRFFSLMGTAIAHRERTPTVPGTPDTRSAVLKELRHLARELNVAKRLQAYGEAVQTLSSDKQSLARAHFYLLSLDPRENVLTIDGFAARERDEAERAYVKAEQEVRENPGTDAVLVSVDSLAALKRAYPNYFADARMFLNILSQTLE